MKNLATIPLLFLPFSGIGQTYVPSPIFGTNGAVRTDVALGADVANAHALLPSGKLLLVGGGYDINLNSFHVGLVQMDTVCGALDPAFGNGGKISQTHEQRTKCDDMTVLPDGRIVCCGMIAPNNFGSEQWPGVYRFLSNGSVDSTFNGTGYHRLAFNGGTGEFNACLINPSGSITCTATGFFTGIGAVRFNSDGTLDTGFGTGGTAVFALPSIAALKGTGLLRPDGSVVSIAPVAIGNDYMLALAQFDALLKRSRCRIGAYSIGRGL